MANKSKVLSFPFFIFKPRRPKGFTLIELLVVLAILSILILAGVWIWKRQLLKARDAKRKSDLKIMQNALEDYFNDNNCYPSADDFNCDDDFSPYLTKIPCDPINSSQFNYFYSTSTQACPRWYKIFVKFENEGDPSISKVDCSNGCGPDNHYSFWASSSNITSSEHLADEISWPEFPYDCINYAACNSDTYLPNLSCGQLCPLNRKCSIVDSEYKCCYTGVCSQE